MKYLRAIIEIKKTYYIEIEDDIDYEDEMIYFLEVLNDENKGSE